MQPGAELAKRVEDGRDEALMICDDEVPILLGLLRFSPNDGFGCVLVAWGERMNHADVHEGIAVTAGDLEVGCLAPPTRSRSIMADRRPCLTEDGHHGVLDELVAVGVDGLRKETTSDEVVH